MSDANNKPEECENCCFSTDELSYYKNSGPPKDDHLNYWLCELCADTKNWDIDMTMRYIGNKILEALK